MRYASLFLALALAGCASAPPRVLQSGPPASLLEPCYEPAGAPQTNGELLGYALALRDALRGCNDDKAALREWAKEMK